jgi:hypothetical protein
MSKFQRDLNAAERELDLLDRAVILTYAYSLWGEQTLHDRWPDDRALREPATLEQMIYLCGDRLNAAQKRNAAFSETVFRNIIDALGRIQSDIIDPSELG